MEKEDFIKEVTTLFTEKKVVELNTFLTKNAELTVKNKRLIKTLNDSFKVEMIPETIKKIEANQKLAEKNLNQNIYKAINSLDVNLLLESVSGLDINKKIYLLPSFISAYHNNATEEQKKKYGELYGTYLKSLYPDMDKLSKNYKHELKKAFLSSFYIGDCDAGEFYCNQTKDINDEITLLSNKADSVGNRNRTISKEDINIINTLFDKLEGQTKKEPNSYNPLALYFMDHHPQAVFLTSERFDKLKLDKQHLLDYLLDYCMYNHANYLISKQSEKVDVELGKYFDAVSRGAELKNVNVVGEHIDSKDSLMEIYKAFCGSEYEFNFDSFKQKIASTNSIVKDLTVDDEALEDAIQFLTKEQLVAMFKESTVFKLTEDQLAKVDTCINNYEDHIVDLINSSFLDKQWKVVPFVNENLDNEHFISKLSVEGKENLLMCSLDFSKIKDDNKFIKNFLEEITMTEFSCYHAHLIQVLGAEKSEISAYILNEKVAYPRGLPLYEMIEVYHLLNDKNKTNVLANFKSTDLTHIEKNPELLDQEKINLAQIKADLGIKNTNSKKRKSK